MGSPINSGGDDFSFVVDYYATKQNDVVQQGYFSSSRLGAGKDDIYRFSKKSIIPEPIEVIDTIEKIKNVFVTVQTKVNVYQEIDNPNSPVVNKIALPDTYIKIVDQNNDKILESYSDRNGFFYSEIPIDRIMKVIGSKITYLNASKELETRNLSFKKGENAVTLNVELVMEKIYTDKEINLANIYYDYDKWNIKDEAKPTLNHLITILNDNPQINIQLSSHTDCRGTQAYNEELSQKRAQSVVDYLISKSISPSRLFAKGYGASLLVDLCDCNDCSEAQHQINRRTTFKILKR
jgi:outer membrane protein OmpA-like peptidoglycan-associated protein